MLDELAALLANMGPQTLKGQYSNAIIEGNCLAKNTVATRRLTSQRLTELYALDSSVQIFRVLRHLWDVQENGRPLLALLCAIARDPLLAATIPAVLGLPAGADFLRTPMKDALRDSVGERLNEAILDKVTRNAASSWTQSGHLEGRTLKKRKIVEATPSSVSFALFLAHKAGLRGQDLFNSAWMAILDCAPATGQQLALEAKSIGLIDLRMAGSIIDIRLDRLDPIYNRRI